MPVYEYVCTTDHVTTRFVPIAKAPGPKTIRCTMQVPDPTARVGLWGGSTDCGKRAKRREVYKTMVQGDLPTRGAF